jgi:hypothetical protein
MYINVDIKRIIPLHSAAGMTSRHTVLAIINQLLLPHYT